MDYGQLFQWANLLVLPGWLLLLLAPRWRWTRRLVLSGGYSTVFALGYLLLIVHSWGAVELDFASLAGVQTLFQHPAALLAGWVHYLAFDLFIGGWILRSSWEMAMPHYWVAPLLLLTFYLGPIGFLLFMVLRILRAASGGHCPAQPPPG